MTSNILVNLSGRPIPPEAKISISGEPSSGGYLVVESFNGVSGTAVWRTEAEFNVQRAATQTTSTGAARPAWSPPLKPKAPYS
jgi:hypothetical protein